MWEEGTIVNGPALSLPEYLRMWERAGRRCAGEQFDDVYCTTLQSNHTSLKNYLEKNGCRNCQEISRI